MTIFCVPVLAQQSGKPLLSQEIRTVLERDGAETAELRFSQLFPAEKDRYEVDQTGFGELAAEWMQRGDFATGQVVMQMLTTVVEASLAELELQLPSDPPAAETNPEPSASAQRQASDSETATMSLGPARDDLSRFTGVYGTPENVETGRTLFVTVSCDGHLVAGPMWADTSPWWMKSTSDPVFEHRWNTTYVRMEFALGPDGHASSMKHNIDVLDATLPRAGSLPDGWTECVRPSWG